MTAPIRIIDFFSGFWKLNISEIDLKGNSMEKWTWGPKKILCN